MKTVSLTHARANLGKLCEEAKKGVRIGIISGDQILQIKPVEVVPWDETYIATEYGITESEARSFLERTEKEIAAKEKKGSYVTFKGKFDPSKL
jgi:hypothetical protein